MREQQAHLSHPKYRPDIDGLRAVAVLAVVGFHAFPSLVCGGFTGVDVFFVISGFLITTIIFQNLDQGTFRLSEFYARRIRRIFPALIVVLSFCLALGWFLLLADEFNQLGKHIAAGAGFVANFILWREVGYFDNSAETKPLLHLWSLSIEEQFYVIWPPLLWFAWRRKCNLFTISLVCAVVSFVLNMRGIKHDATATFYSPQTRFWELLSGSLLAWGTLHKNGPFLGRKRRNFFLMRVFGGESRKGSSRALENILSIIGSLLLVFGFCRFNKELPFPGKVALLPVMSALLIISAGSKAWVNRTILSNKIAVWFGLISFPLYLWHWPLLSFARIVEGDVPSSDIRIGAVVLSVVLAWLTTRFIEKPIRYGGSGTVRQIVILCGSLLLLGVIGFVVSKADLSRSHGYEKLAIKRKGFEHAFGSSMAWYRGKQDWLFLGNQYNNSVAKLKLATVPKDDEIETTKKLFKRIAEAGSKFNSKVVLIVGPNKESVYSEYLPEELIPSSKRYIEFFLEEIRDVPNLMVYDPTDDLRHLKHSEGLLYWMTDTHWNNKGAYCVFSGAANLLGLPVPAVEFKQESTRRGDLVDISKLQKFPLHKEDHWEVIWKRESALTESEISDEQKTSFGPASVVINNKPLSNKYIWVVGDSFANGLKPFLNATFQEVRYVGLSDEKLKSLPDNLASVDRKPDIILIVRAERNF